MRLTGGERQRGGKERSRRAENTDDEKNTHTLTHTHTHTHTHHTQTLWYPESAEHKLNHLSRAANMEPSQII